MRLSYYLSILLYHYSRHWILTRLFTPFACMVILQAVLLFLSNKAWCKPTSAHFFSKTRAHEWLIFSRSYTWGCVLGIFSCKVDGMLPNKGKLEFSISLSLYFTFSATILTNCSLRLSVGAPTYFAVHKIKIFLHHGQINMVQLHVRSQIYSVIYRQIIQEIWYQHLISCVIPATLQICLIYVL